MAELKFEKLPDNMSAQERKLIEYHRNNLNKGTYLDDEQGMTTVFITGVTGPDGRIYNIPGYFDGKRQTEEAAREWVDSSNSWGNYPSYETGKSSNEAAIKLHDVIGRDGDLFRSFKYGERQR